MHRKERTKKKIRPRIVTGMNSMELYKKNTQKTGKSALLLAPELPSRLGDSPGRHQNGSGGLGVSAKLFWPRQQTQPDSPRLGMGASTPNYPAFFIPKSTSAGSRGKVKLMGAVKHEMRVRGGGKEGVKGVEEGVEAITRTTV